MYLKSIEIQGFKSFAHKTLLNFNHGVTAIVGPNGSGKSNISDAVRWVLGEQKVKQLRGSNMQDVIFAGTEVRKPQSFAFVAITLDNSDHVLPSDYTEITVSRRLFRSGESEYMINGRNVRLKDVQELFFDTGIGKEGYSIIGQGQIEAILNGRPEDRRGLFDEAAGIVKFKRRKLTAIKKLESENANLQRITDVTDELEKRLKPLEKQQEVARKYLKLKDEQKELDLNLFVREIRQLLDEKERINSNLDLTRASSEDAKQNREELNKSSASIAERLNSLDELISGLRDGISKGQLLKTNLEGQIELREAAIKTDKDGISRSSEDLDKLDAEERENLKNGREYISALDTLEQNVRLLINNETEAGIEDNLAGLHALLTKAVELKKELSIRACEEARAMAENEDCGEPVPADGKQGSESGDPVPADSDGSGGLQRSGPAEGSKRGQQGGRKDADPNGGPAYRPQEDGDDDDDFEFELPSWLKEIKNKKGDLKRVKEDEKKNLSWLNTASEEYNRLTDRLNSLRKTYSDKQREYAYANAGYEQLKNIAERYEGFGESVKAVMGERQRLGGIRGAVAELIKTEKRYEQAIETALGGRIQNIVTDTEQSAKRCVEYLKKSKRGRATFLPLNAIKAGNRELGANVLREPGVLDRAVGLVSFEAEFTGLMEYLLGNILVVDNIDNALYIARKYRYSLRIVTLDGELMSPGGAISGGAYKNSSGIMGRSRELDELRENARKIKLAIEKVRDDISHAERLVNEKNSEIDSINENLKSIALEKKELSVSIMSDVKLRFNELSQKIGFAEENIRRVINSFDSTASRRSGLNEKLEEHRASIKAAEDEIRKRREDIFGIDEDIKKADAELNAYIAEKNEISGTQNEQIRLKEELDQEILEIEKELLRLENMLEKNQSRIDSLTGYIWDEYELGLSQAEAFYNEELGAPSSIRSRLSAVKNDIKALGPVNVQAIEEYKEVSERYGFLKGQQDDLIKSAEAVSRIIAELDEEMKKQFRKNFELIRAGFRAVFAELFGGGDAELELVYEAEEPGDELEAGILINVRPPGKKLQNMLQLSGGEKALTAIALLFAIQSLKPSPFCLLDEIEAALDDSNVVRFAGYLHRLTDSTQFIVITHRRGTMEAADRLYGVTMQEKGISKLVSVDLVSDQLT